MTLWPVIFLPKVNLNDIVLEKGAPKPFIDHSAREEANSINTFLRDNLEPNTLSMSGNNGSGQGGGMVAYYGQPAGIAYYGPAQGHVGYGGQVKEETFDSGPPQGGQGQQEGAPGQQGAQGQQGGNKSSGYGYGGNYRPYGK